MCFSATGSFIAAAVNAGVGFATLRGADHPSETPLAIIPGVFAVQQAIEGFLWLTLPDAANAGISGELANGFVVIALAVWPVLVPLAALLVEKDRGRRKVLLILSICGGIYAAYSAVGIYQAPYQAHIASYCIGYANGQTFPTAAGLAYGVLTCIPLLMSSDRTLQVLGVWVVAGLTISMLFFFYAFLSVWCFFAAVASCIVFFHIHFPQHRQLGFLCGPKRLRG